jgi:hypothetical protein
LQKYVSENTTVREIIILGRFRPKLEAKTIKK